MYKGVLVIFLLLTVNSLAQKTDKKLTKKIETLLSGFNGTVGVFVKSLKTNKVVSINADSIFPTASIVQRFAGLQQL